MPISDHQMIESWREVLRLSNLEKGQIVTILTSVATHPQTLQTAKIAAQSMGAIVSQMDLPPVNGEKAFSRDALAYLGTTPLTGNRAAIAALTESDLANGVWSGAQVQIYRTDWSDVSLRVKVWTGELGEVRHDGVSFRADLNGLSRRLERSIGRIYSRHCDASFGDARCGLDASLPAYRGTGMVTGQGPAGIVVSGLSGFAEGWFSSGWLDWTSGVASGCWARRRWRKRWQASCTRWCGSCAGRIAEICW